MTTDAELEAATKEVAAAEPTGAELVKSLREYVERLEKGGDFGNTAAAHNGNDADKSSPDGDGKPSGGYATTDEEENVDGEGRVKRSTTRSRDTSQTAAPATTLKSEQGKTLKKGEEADVLTEDRVYENIAKGEGAAADDYRTVVDASDAIQYLTDELVKAIAHVSKQGDAAAKATNARIDRLEKSLAAANAGNAILVKSMAHLISETDSLAKSEVKAPQSNGKVVVVQAAPSATPSAAGRDKGSLMKSIARAITSKKVDEMNGANVMANLDVQADPAAYFDSLPKSFRDSVLEANAN